LGAALGVFLACRPCETRSEIRRVCSDEVVVGLGLTGKVTVMTAVVESIRVPVAGGGGVRAGTALAPGTAGEPENTAVGRHGMSRSPNIADRYAVVLQPLSPRQRLGVIATLSVGFYDGWRPTREELATYVAAKFGVTATAAPDRRDPCRR